MSTLLLTVEDSFQIAGRGVAVTPGPREDAYTGPRVFAVRLRLPSGKQLPASLQLEHIRKTPPPNVLRWVCVLKGMNRADVPIGTEVWID